MESDEIMKKRKNFHIKNMRRKWFKKLGKNMEKPIIMRHLIPKRKGQALDHF
jgi:hypothetical protein